LLGAHAHYYTGGKVPDRVDDRGEGFKILDVGRRQGSLIFDIALLLTGKPIWDVAETQYGFDRFLAESYAAHRARRLFEEPPYERRQAAPAGHSPLPDLDYAREYERRRLLQRTQQAVSFISAPLGSRRQWSRCRLTAIVSTASGRASRAAVTSPSGCRRFAPEMLGPAASSDFGLSELKWAAIAGGPVVFLASRERSHFHMSWPGWMTSVLALQ
jgi:hypothetical protein